MSGWNGPKPAARQATIRLVLRLRSESAVKAWQGAMAALGQNDDPVRRAELAIQTVLIGLEAELDELDVQLDLYGG